MLIIFLKTFSFLFARLNMGITEIMIRRARHKEKISLVSLHHMNGSAMSFVFYMRSVTVLTALLRNEFQIRESTLS